jgi:hypothetical protein
LFSFVGNAQITNQKQALPIVQYDQNVEEGLTKVEQEQLKAVYGNELHNQVLSKPHRLKAIKNILRNRVEILEFPNPNDQKNCTLLSDISLFNYYVPELKRDIVFNVNTFNPLKYNFEFYSRGAHMYRVDNTNYFILIKSQHQK